VQLARAEHDQHHELVEVVAAARNADLLAHDRMPAVAADNVICLQNLGLTVFRDSHARAAGVLLNLRGGPAESRLDARLRRHLGAQHLLHLVLRQPVVLLEVIVVHQLAAGRCKPIRSVQVAIAGDLADREARRQETRRAQLIDDAHEIEMLERAVGEVLALGDAAKLGARLHQRAGDAPHPKLHGERHADRAAAHDHHLKTPCHSHPSNAGRFLPAIRHPAPSSAFWRPCGCRGMNTENLNRCPAFAP
jgi:hypothetical protein